MGSALAEVLALRCLAFPWLCCVAPGVFCSENTPGQRTALPGRCNKRCYGLRCTCCCNPLFPACLCLKHVMRRCYRHAHKQPLVICVNRCSSVSRLVCGYVENIIVAKRASVSWRLSRHTAHCVHFFPVLCADCPAAQCPTCSRATLPRAMAACPLTCMQHTLLQHLH